GRFEPLAPIGDAGEYFSWRTRRTAVAPRQVQGEQGREGQGQDDRKAPGTGSKTHGASLPNVANRTHRQGKHLLTSRYLMPQPTGCVYCRPGGVIGDGRAAR